MKKRMFVLASMLALVAALFTLSAFAADNVRYVANTTRGTGDGLTAANATTLDQVFTELNTNIFTRTAHANEACKVYLVEDITLMQYRPEGKQSPKTSQCFSEDAHPNNPVTIETASGVAKAKITFNYSGASATRVYNYLCSGETTFDNVIFTTDSKGTAQIPVIAAQGNKLTLGKKVEVSVTQGCHRVAVVGVTFNINTFRSTQSESKTADFHPEVTVLGGDYEYIAAFSFNTDISASSTAKLTLGDIKVGTLSASNYNNGTVNAGTVTNIYYTGKVEAENFWPTRRRGDGNPGNASTFNHYLKSGAEITYTALDISKATNATLNLYFVPTNATATKTAAALYQLWNGNAQIGTFGFSTLANDTTCAGSAHTQATGTLTEATCSAGGLKFNYCSVCCTMIDNVYEGTLDPTKHKEGSWTVADSGNELVKNCATCGQQMMTYPVTDGKVAVYCSADGTAGGGESKENPVNTLRGAQNLAAQLADVYYGGDDTETPVTIYIIGRVDMPSKVKQADGTLVGNKVSSADLNKFNHVFEETAHIDHPFVFTSLDGAERGSLNFLTVDSGNPTNLLSANVCYMLYGPTTFENISFSAFGGEYEGVTYPARRGHSILARGFKLVLGEGIEMIDISGKINPSQALTTSTSTLTVSDIKLYVVGGFYCSGSTVPNCEESKYGDPYNADVTVLSGEYWYIGAFNRNGPNVTNTTGTLTIGSPKTMFLTATSTGNAVLSNVKVDVIYKGAAKVNKLYFGAQDGHTGSGSGGYGNGGYTCNHLFFDGSAGFTAYNIYAPYRDVLNFYYTDRTAALASTLADGHNVDKVDVMPEFCIDFRSGHTFGADGKCTFCGVKQCTTHDYSGFKVVTAATCNEKATGYYYCVDCHERQDIVSVGEFDANNHAYESAGDHLECTRCHKELSVSEPVVYVTDIPYIGTADGATAKTPLTSFNEAYMLALSAAQDGKATIYIVGGTTIPLDSNGCYLEPAHADVEVTIKGYGDSAAAFVFDRSYVAKIEYGLNGPVVFDNIEIGNKSTSQIYFSARHNHLTMGKKVSMDFRRNVGGGESHSGAVTVLGGCYSTKFGSCSGTDAHLTLYSGIYRNVICGSASRDCGLTRGKCTLEILGDVSSREAIYAGSSGGNVGDIDLIVKGGNASAGQYLTFGSSSGKRAGDVRVFLYSGTISSGLFTTNGSKDAVKIMPIGSASSTGSIFDNKTSLTFYYDPSDPSSREMMRMIQRSSIGGDRATFIVLDSLCTVSADGEHTHAVGATPIETVERTCFTDGYEIYECTACHKEYAVSTGTAAHSFGVATEIEPTCKDYGMTAETCTICGYTKYTVDESKEPDADAHSFENGICTICHYSAAADCEHAWASDTVTEQTKCGTTVYKVCTKCDLRETVSTTGNHNWGAYTVTVEPTDTAPGTKTRKCKTCGKVETALLYPNDPSLATDAIAVDASGNAVGFSIENAKLTKAEKAVLNALLQDTAYGSEVKVSYTTDGTTVTNVTYSIPVPDEYKDYENVKVVVKDDDGNFHTVDFKIEKGYIVFTF